MTILPNRRIDLGIHLIVLEMKLLISILKNDDLVNVLHKDMPAKQTTVTKGNLCY